MNTYRIEIQDLKSKATRVAERPGCGFAEEGTRHEFTTRMCDCNLAGYFHAEVIKQNGEERQLPHNITAGRWLETNKCDHSMPPTRFKAVRAHLDSGTVAQL
jgi:hypothetical protein